MDRHAHRLDRTPPPKIALFMTSTSPENGIHRIAIVGVGLLGGSVAKAIRRADSQIMIVGVSRTKATRDSALELGVVDEAHESIEAGCRDCDVVVIATPVDRIASQAIQVATVTSESCLITDVGSTKAGIVNAIADSPAATKFVAAHPIAGSEKTGVQHATADLFDGKLVIITPTESTTSRRREQAETFWRMTGGHCITMSPDEHDEQLAIVSHVPHLISSLVAKLTPAEASTLTGSGWRDITRVAAGDPPMWAAICQENRQAIVRKLQHYSAELSHMTKVLEDGDDDALLAWLTEAQVARKSADGVSR